MKASSVNLLSNVNLRDSDLLLNWIGQAGYIIKTKTNKIICIDPYYSNSIERYEGRPARRMWYNDFIIEEFKPDIVLCSHDHLDHTDPETIPLLYSYSDAQFYGPKSSYLHMEKMRIPENRISLLEEDTIYEFDGFNLKTVFADHTEYSLGFIMYINDVKIYFTGDTSLHKRLYELKSENIDIMISCVNGKYGNLNFIESINLAKELGVKKIIPMHYGLIPNNTVNIKDFIELCIETGLEVVELEVEKNYFIKKQNELIEIKSEEE